MEQAAIDSLRRDSRLQMVKIVVCAALALLFLALSILELVAAAPDAVTVQEEFTVSSSLIRAGSDRYLCQINGRLLNEGDEGIVIERVTVTVAKGSAQQDVVLEGLALPPRTGQYFYHSWEDTRGFDRVLRLSVTVNGQDDVLINAQNNTGVSGLLVFYLILLAVAVFFLVREWRIYGYVQEEKRMLL